MRTGVVAHGAGSCGQTALRLLPAEALGLDSARYLEDRSGDVTAVMAQFDREVRDVGTVVAGLSLGAHAVARWAALGPTPPPDALVLALPAWTGAPGDIAALTGRTGADVAVRGRQAHLAGIPATADRTWVLAELHRGWETHSDASLAACLARAAASPGPTIEELRSINVATVIVGFDDDPLHPAEVARAWADLIPGARLALVSVADVQADRAALGLAAGGLLAEALAER